MEAREELRRRLVVEVSEGADHRRRARREKRSREAAERGPAALGGEGGGERAAGAQHHELQVVEISRREGGHGDLARARAAGRQQENGARGVQLVRARVAGEVEHATALDRGQEPLSRGLPTGEDERVRIQRGDGRRLPRRARERGEVALLIGIRRRRRDDERAVPAGPRIGLPSGGRAGGLARTERQADFVVLDEVGAVLVGKGGEGNREEQLVGHEDDRGSRGDSRDPRTHQHGGELFERGRGGRRGGTALELPAQACDAVRERAPSDRQHPEPALLTEREPDEEAVGGRLQLDPRHGGIAAGAFVAARALEVAQGLGGVSPVCRLEVDHAVEQGLDPAPSVQGLPERAAPDRFRRQRQTLAQVALRGVDLAPADPLLGPRVQQGGQVHVLLVSPVVRLGSREPLERAGGIERADGPSLHGEAVGEDVLADRLSERAGDLAGAAQVRHRLVRPAERGEHAGALHEGGGQGLLRVQTTRGLDGLAEQVPSGPGIAGREGRADSAAQDLRPADRARPRGGEGERPPSVPPGAPSVGQAVQRLGQQRLGAGQVLPLAGPLQRGDGRLVVRERLGAQPLPGESRAREPLDEAEEDRVARSVDAPAQRAQRDAGRREARAVELAARDPEIGPQRQRAPGGRRGVARREQQRQCLLDARRHEHSAPACVRVEAPGQLPSALRRPMRPVQQPDHVLRRAIHRPSRHHLGRPAAARQPRGGRVGAPREDVRAPRSELGLEEPLPRGLGMPRDERQQLPLGSVASQPREVLRTDLLAQRPLQVGELEARRRGPWARAVGRQVSPPRMGGLPGQAQPRQSRGEVEGGGGARTPFASTARELDRAHRVVGLATGSAALEVCGGEVRRQSRVPR